MIEPTTTGLPKGTRSVVPNSCVGITGRSIGQEAEPPPCEEMVACAVAGAAFCAFGVGGCAGFSFWPTTAGSVAGGAADGTAEGTAVTSSLATSMKPPPKKKREASLRRYPDVARSPHLPGYLPTTRPDQRRPAPRGPASYGAPHGQSCRLFTALQDRCHFGHHANVGHADNWLV